MPIKHGHARHGQENPTYIVWLGMRRRCLDKGDNAYYLYGARGITICERWGDYRNFYEDMGERPEGRTMDRIDNNGNYEPGNCRWATITEQNRNTRSNRFIAFAGETLTIRQWELRLGSSQGVIRPRLERGWALERALTQPLRKQKNNWKREELGIAP